MNDPAGPEAYEIVLVGGGHAQLAVIKDWIDNGLPVARAALVDPQPYARYSGTVPGIISGQHEISHGLVDLEGLCRRAGIERIEAQVAAIDPDGRTVALDDGNTLTFTYASIDTGGVGRAADILGGSETLLDVRPIHGFVEGWRNFTAQARDEPPRIAVIGGGAGGVELAFAIRNAKGLEHTPQVALIAGSAGLLPGFGSWPRGLVERELEAQGIALVEEDARFDDGELLISARPVTQPDLAIAAVGSGAPEWPGDGGLATDAQGFIAVDAHQRSTSHPYVFASGDVARRMDLHVPHSGVHAVHTGPVLAANLRALAKGEALTESYTPRPASLYLLATGTKDAIMAYGWLGGRGAWAQRWKERIDKRWLDQYGSLEGNA